MYIPQIKEKYSLVDLARYGTRSRKNIHPDVLVGDHPCPPVYKEGDLLDANAILNLFENTKLGRNKEYDTLEALVKRNKEQATDQFNNVLNKEEQLENTIADLEQKHDSDIEEIKEKQNQDIQEMKQYVAQKIDEATAIVVYDEFDENLLVYNVKHE